jgi:S-adenosylmethionine:tRNA ribosyltransferase-isomerase
LQTSDFDYELPLEYIAQTPVEPRDASRLLVLDRKTGAIQHKHFYEIGEFLEPGDCLVLNRTRVIPARIYARKVPGGGHVELLLLRKMAPDVWEALVGGKGLVKGRNLVINKGIEAEVVEVAEGSKRLVKFNHPIEGILADIGQVPLPPYIHTSLEDPERYQTVFAKEPGSAAAPTAGLHFTSRLIKELQEYGIKIAYVTLHIGLDTFAPVTEESPEIHKIHTEWCELSEEAATTINQVKSEGCKVIAVGTTSVRTIESAVKNENHHLQVAAVHGQTDLYVLPGYKFKIVDGIVTNFHLPKSTLIMMISAFSGRELILSTYEIAKREKYRFYSFGDAMLIL